MSMEETDILVIGSGVAGSLVAWRLAGQGRKVTILEAGPRLDRSDLVERYRQLVDKDDYMAPYPGEPHAPEAGDGSDYIVENGPDRYGTQYIRGVGGTTWHWAAASWRLLPVDFRLKSAHGVGRDWPIGYEDIEPWYQRAELAMGVAGPDPKAEDLGSPRSAPYPQQALPLSYMDRQFAERLNGNGFQVVTEPVARNYDIYDDRPPCCGNNNCMPICPIGAQYAAEVHVAKAEEAGARLIENAVAHEVLVDAGSRRVTGVRYKTPDGQSHAIAAKTVVLAANGIETPKLMLLSSSERLPGGLANSSGMVGRNLMDHPAIAVSFLWDRPVFPGRGPQEMTSVVNFRDGGFRATQAAKKLHLGNVADYRGVTEALLAAGRRGPELDRGIRDRVARKVAISSFHEQLPDPANRIRPSTGHRDAIGIPRPEVSYSIGSYVRDSAAHTRQAYDRIAALLGGTEVTHGEGFTGSSHIMGTCIMGADAKDSVVDGEGRSHDHPNLYIAGSSVFSSAACVNPTLTIAALALRLADTIGRQAG